MIEEKQDAPKGLVDRAVVWLLMVVLMGGFMSLVLMLCFPLAMFEGWVLHKLWGWYVVSAGLAPPVGVVDMIGLSMLIKVMRGIDGAQRSKLAETLAVSVALPVAALFLGWMLHVAR